MPWINVFRKGMVGRVKDCKQSGAGDEKRKSGKKKGGPVDVSKIKPEEMLKYEIAKELGLYDKVIANGWRSLTAKESGRIGGIMTRRRAAEKKHVSMPQENRVENG